MNSKQTPWKKSRTFGDIYGGRIRLQLNDKIFMRAHSLKRPNSNDQLPILIQDNLSRDFFFPISVYEAKEAIQALPENDYSGITHIWLRRFNKSDYEQGHLPLAEFICGSGVRVIILYPFPKNRVMNLGFKKPSARKLKELNRWCSDIKQTRDGWSIKWDIVALKKYYINCLLYHEVGHHVDWYNRCWSKANKKQLEEFADQYAIQKTATAIHIFNELENK